MKKLLLVLIVCLFSVTDFAQTSAPTKKFSPQQLKEDIAYLQKQIFDAHADPFTELTEPQYEQLFNSISSQLTDSLDANAFYRIIKPVFSYLSDEHCGINIDTATLNTHYKDQPVFLPFSLVKKDNDYFIDQVLTANSGLKKGDKIMRVNNIPIVELLKNCAKYSSGFPDQRADNALKQFGYLYTWSIAAPQSHYKLTSGSGKQVNIDGVALKAWQHHLSADAMTAICTQPLTYTRFGDAGYINSCTFMTHNDKEFNALSAQIDSVFKLANNDKVKYLFIDVSGNGGGNSSVGDVIINDFYGKPYKSYQCNWRRSDEYLNLIKSWGMSDDFYAGKPAGSIIHFDADTVTPSADNPSRFAGKVYVIVGNGTFSSAIMFATIIKDNHIATIIGQTPQNGHPDHFGELYNSALPNTKLKFRFGVKEWIRPAGKLSDNYLRPDKEIEMGKYAGVEEMIEAIKKIY